MIVVKRDAVTDGSKSGAANGIESECRRENAALRLPTFGFFAFAVVRSPAMMAQRARSFGRRAVRPPPSRLNCCVQASSSWRSKRKYLPILR